MKSWSKGSAGTVLVITPVLPKKPFSDYDMRMLTKQFADKATKDIIADLQRPLKKWKHKPVFDSKVEAFYFPLRCNIEVTTTDLPYIYMDGGTVRHFVRPKTAKVLHWVDPVSGEHRFSKGHMVKGIKARRWTMYAKRKWDKELPKRFQALLNEFIKRSGYAV